jgi:hypothetical protein
MSPRSALVCSGAPRDLGLDQGLHFREVIRVEVEDSLRGKGSGRLLSPLTGRGGEVARAVRDTRRYFPHMAERAEGIARGARTSDSDVAALLASDCLAGCETLVGVTPEAEESAIWIALATEREAPLFLRQSQPENGYRSLEIGIPWRVPALAGVNEHGLAVAAGGVVSSAASLAHCAAPAALLVQDCLQRFDRVDKAVEWCERRTAGGDLSILLADAEGALARVDLEGDRRRVHRGTDGILLGAGEPTRVASVERACRASQRLDAEALCRILATRGGRVVALSPGNPEQIFGDLPE